MGPLLSSIILVELKVVLPLVKSNISHKQAIAVRVVLCKQLTICSLYLEPTSNPTYNDLNHLINQLATPFIILGDLNAHNTLWHCNNTNAKGRVVERILEDFNISLLNDDSPTHFTSFTNTTSIIDLGICSSHIFPEFQWNVLKELHGSDHFPIVLKLTSQQKTSAIPRWNLSKANWVLFRGEFSSVEDITSTLDSPVDAYACLEQHIISAATRSIPQTSPSKGRPPVPWWDKTCKLLRKITLKCYDVYRANPSQTNKIIYHRALAKKKRYFKKAKAKS